MPTQIVITLVFIIPGQIYSWRKPGTIGKVVFCLLCLPLIVQSAVGALHAWGESKNLPWTIGYLVSASFPVVLTGIRIRRP